MKNSSLKPFNMSKLKIFIPEFAGKDTMNKRHSELLNTFEEIGLKDINYELIFSEYYPGENEPFMVLFIGDQGGSDPSLDLFPNDREELIPCILLEPSSTINRVYYASKEVEENHGYYIDYHDDSALGSKKLQQDFINKLKKYYCFDLEQYHISNTMSITKVTETNIDLVTDNSKLLLLLKK